MTSIFAIFTQIDYRFTRGTGVLCYKTEQLVLSVLMVLAHTRTFNDNTFSLKTRAFHISRLRLELFFNCLLGEIHEITITLSFFLGVLICISFVFKKNVFALYKQRFMTETHPEQATTASAEWLLHTGRVGARARGDRKGGNQNAGKGTQWLPCHILIVQLQLSNKPGPPGTANPDSRARCGKGRGAIGSW